MGLLLTAGAAALLLLFLVDLLPQHEDPIISTRQSFEPSTNYPQKPPVVILFVYGHRYPEMFFKIIVAGSNRADVENKN